jgi:uncharacterized membrane protein YvbJ
MSYCPKCGNKVDENMTFCPRCGASLKVEATRPAANAAQPSYQRNEKNEKNEKHEKDNRGEKGEKHEKGEFGYIGWLIGGLVLIIIGFFAWFEASGFITGRLQSALVLLVIGIAIIIVAIWLSTTAKRRHPKPSL